MINIRNKDGFLLFKQMIIICFECNQLLSFMLKTFSSGPVAGEYAVKTFRSYLTDARCNMLLNRPRLGPRRGKMILPKSFAHRVHEIFRLRRKKVSSKKICRDRAYRSTRHNHQRRSYRYVPSTLL